jgi:tRNA pseudouridine13 synthase
VTPPEEPAQALLARQGTLPFVTESIPAISGELKQAPEDFVVEELPAYLPSGQGEHLYLWIEKRELNTPDAARALARALSARPEDAGWAGLKDRRAITRQWLSFHCKTTPSAASLELPGIRVLEVSRHPNKLRTGHLRGNRFQLRLAGVPPEHDVHARAVLQRLAQLGLPAYFGAQRFGFQGKNVLSAYAWIVQGERAPQKPFLRKLFVSALQSALFNSWLAERIAQGLFTQALAGDVMRKEDTGGLFLCDEPTTDAARIEQWEISPTGPMFGARMKSAAGSAQARESEELARWGIAHEHFARVERFGEGTRRPARVRPENVTLSRDGTDLLLDFGLPRGAYATELVSELVKRRGLALGEEA